MFLTHRKSLGTSQKFSHELTPKIMQKHTEIHNKIHIMIECVAQYPSTSCEACGVLGWLGGAAWWQPAGIMGMAGLASSCPALVGPSSLWYSKPARSSRDSRRSCGSGLVRSARPPTSGSLKEDVPCVSPSYKGSICGIHLCAWPYVHKLTCLLWGASFLIFPCESCLYSLG